MKCCYCKNIISAPNREGYQQPNADACNDESEEDEFIHSYSYVEKLERGEYTNIERQAPSDSEREIKLVGPNQFLANGVVLDLPKLYVSNITRSIAEAVCDLVLYAARNGAGERQPCKGMLVLVGSQDQFETFGYVQGVNKFEGQDICVQDWKENKNYVLSCFLQDLGMFVDGQTGKILADSYKVDMITREADHHGGSKHVSASAAGMNGCLAIKCSEDCCMADGRGKEDLKLFSGTKTPVSVPVAPS